MSIMAVFRAAIALQPMALLAQALLAGLALSGSTPALGAHMFVGGVILLIAIAQAVTSVVLRRSTHMPGWVVAASISLLIGNVVQMVAGRLQLIAIRLPLGVLLFGASITLFISAFKRSAMHRAASI